MPKYFKKSLYIFSGVIIFFVIAYSFYDRQFKLSNIKGEWPKVHFESLTKNQNSFLQTVFSQPFYYLDRGKQSFVFLSQDNRYVLKFFDSRCLRSGELPFLFPISEEHCSKKLEQLFEGYRVAQSFDRKNTGLLFVQLTPDPAYHIQASIFDRFGFRHQINLEEVPFIIQERAIPLRELITKLLSKGKVKEAEQRLRQMIEMYVEEYRLGIVDLDHNFMYNTGFIGERPLRIDLGRLQFNEEIKDPAIYQQDLKKVFIGRLSEWLERHFPKYRQEIMQTINEEITSLD